MGACKKVGILSVSLVASLSLLSSGAHADAPDTGSRPAATDAARDPQALEAGFVERINVSRHDAGLASLAVRAELLPVARSHSAEMAAAGSISHNRSLVQQVTGGWKLLGENVGMGWSVESLHQAFMNSPGHRANVLGGFDQVAIGVVASGSQLFVTEVFWSSAQAGPATASAAATAPATAATAAATAPTTKKATAKKAPEKVAKKAGKTCVSRAKCSKKSKARSRR